MARIALSLEAQVRLLGNIRRQLAMSPRQLAEMCGAHPRTFSDWSRGKHRMRYEAFQILIQRTGVEVGQEVGQTPEFSHVRAAGRLGALRRGRLYGNPGTPEGRRLGGLRSIARRMAEPNRLVVGGFTLPKPIKEPERSSELAEFIGMMLGDGCLCSAFQAALYFNTETDALHADFMSDLAQRLFGIVPRRMTEPDSKGGTLLFSSKRLVDYLIKLGFARGDKVNNQAGVPPWILENDDYCRNCLRGLMDTDGSVYLYDHRVYGGAYKHMALCFTNRSHPLLRFVSGTLASNGYRPVTTGFRVYLYRRVEVDRYFSDIGTHNAKHLQRYQTYTRKVRHHSRRGGSSPVEGAALEKR